MNLTKPQRATLFAMFGGHCAYCGELLPEKGWHADHVEPIVRDFIWVRIDEPGRTHKAVQTGKCFRPDNERIANFFPSCRACNIDKECYPLDEWRAVLEQRVEVLRRNYSAFRHAERFGLVAQVATRVVFYFEKVGAQ